MSTVAVRELIERGVLRVEDGNHGNDRPRPTEFVDEGVAFIRAADMTSGVVDFEGAGRINSVARARIRKGVGAGGDVILSHKGTVGRIAVAPMSAPDFVCSPQTTFWRSLDPGQLDPRYLRYQMLGAPFQRQLSTLAGQTDMAPYVSLTDQRSITLEVPIISQQRAIAEVLGALDDKIAANDRVIEVADELRSSLVATSRSTVTVGQIATQHARSLSPAAFAEMVDHYSLPAFDAGARPDRADRDSIKSNKLAVDGPSVLMSKLNPRIPRVWEVPAPSATAVASTEFVVLAPVGVSTSELWAALRAPAATAELASQVAGTSGSHQRVKPADILALEVADPRMLANGVRAVIDALGADTEARRSESQRLAATRDELLPLLMSGKVKVRDAEERVGEVL